MVATPGRLNDFMETKTTTVRNVAYLVLDEAVRTPLHANSIALQICVHWRANRVYRPLFFFFVCVKVCPKSRETTSFFAYTLMSSKFILFFLIDS
jgi:hypothetical protein